MRIIIDGMGGDHAPSEIVKGALEALPLMGEEHDIVIVGNEEMIGAELKKNKYDGERIRIKGAAEVIGNEEAPVKAVRTKKDASIVVGLNMLRDGKGDLFISAGSTGALLAGGLFIVRRIQGIDRPTLATVYPILGGEPALMADAGANAECKPANLLEFGIMGSIYMEKVIGRKNPTVGLVNIGVEENKGTTMTRAAFEMLKKSHMNFTGNVEAREVPRGACDVIVCDGFVGNVILKLTEGLALNIMSLLKRKFTSSTRSKMGALLLKKQIMELKEEFDYTE